MSAPIAAGRSAGDGPAAVPTPNHRPSWSSRADRLPIGTALALQGVDAVPIAIESDDVRSAKVGWGVVQ